MFSKERYEELYRKLIKEFTEDDKTTVSEIVSIVSQMCVYLKGLEQKNCGIPFFSSSTFGPKVQHLNRVLNPNPTSIYSDLSDFAANSPGFQKTVTGNSLFKTSKEYQKLARSLLQVISELPATTKEDCLAKCQQFVSTQFPQIQIPQANQSATSTPQ